LYTKEKRLQFRVTDSTRKEIKLFIVAIKNLENISSIILNVKAKSNYGYIIKLFILEITHWVFCSNAQFQKQFGI